MRLSTDAAALAQPNRYGKKLSEVHQGHDVHVIGVFDELHQNPHEERPRRLHSHDRRRVTSNSQMLRSKNLNIGIVDQMEL